MLFAIIAFCSIFLLIASLGLLLFYRQAMVQRITAVIHERQGKKGLAGKLESAGSTLTSALGKIEKVVPRSESEVGVIQQRLVRAGFREDSAIKFFYASRVLAMVVLLVAATVTGVARQNPIVFYIAALGLGYIAPDFFVKHLITKRQDEIRRGLPDVLDMIVVCLEAGLGLDQATARTAQELVKTHPTIADELDVLVLEQRAGRPRSDCWRSFAERSDVDVVRTLVSTLVQSEQFGTGIAKTLRTHAESMRTQRIQKVEEKAAKAGIKLLFPLVIFIFPVLFIVVIGPAIIIMQQQFQEFLNH
jgi:tight adherence protein C